MPPWRIRIARRARRDLREVLAWTRQEFGARQASRYQATLEAAIARLAEGPAVFGSRPAHASRPGLRSLPIGGRGRHILVYREAEPGTILLLRVLHDAMDLPRHLPPAADG